MDWNETNRKTKFFLQDPYGSNRRGEKSNIDADICSSSSFREFNPKMTKEQSQKSEFDPLCHSLYSDWGSIDGLKCGLPTFKGWSTMQQAYSC
jgi:hypothetical protein